MNDDESSNPYSTPETTNILNDDVRETLDHPVTSLVDTKTCAYLSIFGIISSLIGDLYYSYVYIFNDLYSEQLENTAAVFLYITGFVFFFWSSKTMQNSWNLARLKNLPTPSITPGWSIAWYFIPIASLWKPFEAMKEMWTATFGQGKSAVLVAVWWTGWVGSSITNFVYIMNENLDDNLMVSISSTFFLVSGLALIKIIKSLTDRQQEYKNPSNS